MSALNQLLKLIHEPSDRRTLKDSQNIDNHENSSCLRGIEGCLSKGSVIVYVWRKKDAEIITERLQSSELAESVVCYHGGMDAGARAKAQSKVGLDFSAFVFPRSFAFFEKYPYFNFRNML